MTAFHRLSGRLFRPALDARTIGPRSPVVLVAARGKDSYQLVHGLVATAVAAERDARVVAFRVEDRPSGFRSRLRLWRGPSVQEGGDAVLGQYRAFSDEQVVLRPTWRDMLRVKFAIRRYLAAQPSRRDLELFSIGGVRVGDLAFDAYVASGRVVAVDPLDPRILHELTRLSTRALAIRRFLRWNPCCAVIVKDLAYAIGVPGRVALSTGIDAYAASLAWCDRLSFERPEKDLVHLDYVDELHEMSETDRISARELGAEFLKQRLSPGSGGFTVTGVDVWAEDSVAEVPAFPQPASKTILVATHSFTDAQHAGGIGLFSDSFSWLEFLHEVAGETNYHWFIKLHPDQRDTELGVREAVSALFADRENVHVLDPSVTHYALRRHGIDLVLTVFGTIALEYPASGIPAMTARPANPHTSFDYALHPKSVDEYRSILLDPNQWTYEIPADQVAEYAYLHYLVGGSVFDEITSRELSEGDVPTNGDSPIHLAWEALEDDRLHRILELYRDWVRSGSYSLNRYAALRDGGHRRLLDDYRKARAAGQTGRLPLRLP
jgi:hypothetical protein